MRAALFALPLVAGSCLALQATPARALNTVCTAQWAANATAGVSASTPIVGTGYNCPSSTVNVTVTVGSGSNAGDHDPDPTYNWGIQTGSSNFPTTSKSSIDLGVPANTNENLTVTFSQTVYNPYLYFGFTDSGTSFTFNQAFALVQANNATKAGNTVQLANAQNTNADGFVVQMAGTYGPGSNLVFSYNNSTGASQSVTFTTGVYYVPGPVPLLGAAAAFGASRRLRRRIKSAG